jgi:hypothetical protein
LAPIRPTRRFALFGVLALALGACLAPTLPIPPPSSPDVSVPDANGLVTVKGGAGSAHYGAIVYGCNQSTSCNDRIHGSAVSTDGSWEIDPLPAKRGDEIIVWQVIGQDTSPPSYPVAVP